jgi:Ner family transcriptional regulator
MNEPPRGWQGDETTDWHPADVQAALKKRGRSLAGISTDNGYHPTAAGKALKKPWPAMEKIIADELGRDPSDIWPSRYTAGRDQQDGNKADSKP